MLYTTCCLLLLCLHIHCIPIDDPSEWPGHLEPFGSKQKTVDIADVVYDWPTPHDFFRKYVDKTKPLLVKGVYRHSTPVKSWSDENLIKHPDAKIETVMEEPSVIENRSATQREVTFYEFLNTYHKKPILTFSTMPMHLKKDVMLPSPLKCNETRKSLVNANIVLSQGGSKSIVHGDDEETIYCVYRGTFDFLLVEYTKNKNYVIDKPQGGYATIDVQRVDYVKYPRLRKIDEYIKISMEPGDCLYIPYRWYKQYNGHANKFGQSISLNLWFKHMHDHFPSECSLDDKEATLDKFQYLDMILQEEEEESIDAMEKLSAGDNKTIDVGHNEQIVEERSYGGESLLLHFHHYVKAYKKNITLPHFYHIIKKDGTLTRQNHHGLKFPKSFQILVKELFGKLDINNDKLFTEEDIKLISKNEQTNNNMEKYLEYQTARIEDYVEDLIEAKHHDEPIHAFEKRMLEQIKSARPFDEL